MYNLHINKYILQCIYNIYSVRTSYTCRISTSSLYSYTYSTTALFCSSLSILILDNILLYNSTV